MDSQPSQDRSIQNAHAPLTALGARFLLMRIGHMSFAIPLTRIKEVVIPMPLTPLPYVPNYVRGLMALRGQIICVLDLKLKLLQKKTDMTEETTVIIFDSPHHVGAIVDSVDKVVAVNASAIQEVGPERRGESYGVLGILQFEDSLSQILDLDPVLQITGVDAYRKVRTAKTNR